MASDMSSGVDYYEVQVDNGAVVKIAAAEPYYKATDLGPGGHTIIVKAYDKAGNFVTSSHNFVVPVETVASSTEKAVTGTLFSPDGYLLGNGAVLITVLSIVIPTLALLLVLGYLLFVSWSAFGGFRKRIDKEVAEARIMVSRAFVQLKADLEVDIKTLENAGKKRELTRTELKLLKKLRDNIEVAEKVITKEVTDIEAESRS